MMISFAKDLTEEMIEKVRKLRKDSSKGKITCSIPYAVGEVLKGYYFPDPSLKNKVSKILYSRLGRNGARVTNANRKRKTEKEEFNKKQTSLHLVA